MNAKIADQLGNELKRLVQLGQVQDAVALLEPVLAERTPFRYLDRIGGSIDEADPVYRSRFNELIAQGRSEGGWVIIGSVLRHDIDDSLPSALQQCRDYACVADIWYGSDILGERVPGPALVSDFNRTLSLLAPWRVDDNRWVRRMVGVAAHFWAKRSRGSADLETPARELLAFLSPMFGEWEMDSVKGVGWGLKTLGRHYPVLMAEWLPAQLHRRHRALMRRKAVTYLPDELKARALGILSD